ncbi:unnamed protein product, partial (macronuclear) [Paramecium tetraurelia]
MLIFEIYEWQTQISKKVALDINMFENCWKSLQQQCLTLDVIKTKSETPLKLKEIENIQSFLMQDELISLKSNEALRSLSLKLQKLWSVEKYKKMMEQINLHKLVETPYMMEIIVQVLPEMMMKATEIIKLKLTFLENFPNMIKEFYQSSYQIKMYQQQKKKYIVHENNEKESEVTVTDVENLNKINYYEIAVQVWNKMEENSVNIQFFSFQERNDLKSKLFRILDHNLEQLNNAFEKIIIQKERIIEVVCNALYELNLTSFDFYDEFINQYHYQQIDKQRNLGKQIQIDRFLHDIKKYSTKLAKVMSTKQTTQVQYQQQGFLYQEKKEEQEWQNEFFDDDDHQFGSYKKDLRSCSLIQQKGVSFQFVHKSIQEFYIAADLHALLVLSKDLKKQTFNWIIEQLSKENNYDENWLEYSSNQMIQENQIKFHSSVRQQKDAFKKDIESTLNILRILSKHEFFVENYSTETYAEARKYLIEKIKKETLIIEFLKFLVNLTKIDESFIQSGSNSLNLLVEMQVDLTSHNFEKIRIKNTSIIGGNFANCNLSLSEFTDVNINGINLNGAFMFWCKWNNLKINDLHSLDGHSKMVNSVNFSPDGAILA